MKKLLILVAVMQLCNIVLLIININIFQINGKRGFANRRHLQETRVYQRNEQVLYAAPPEAQYYEAQLGGPGKGETFMPKVEKILKSSLDSIPSPSASVKIQMGGKVCLRCKGKHCWALSTFGNKKFVDITKECFAILK